MSNQQLKDAGLKVTLPRVKILNILEHAEERHLSAEDVYKLLLSSGEDVGLATVYEISEIVYAALLIALLRNYPATPWALRVSEGDSPNRSLYSEENFPNWETSTLISVPYTR